MRLTTLRWLLPLVLLLSAGCATTGGPKSIPEEAQVTGTASYYAHRFHGHETASGSIYDEHALTAAHRTLPFGTRVRVTNLENDRSVMVTVTDRGPANHSRVIDLSRRAAEVLGFLGEGTTRVRLDVLADR
jgi:rare lipoprotein A